GQRVRRHVRAARRGVRPGRQPRRRHGRQPGGGRRRGGQARSAGGDRLDATRESECLAGGHAGDHAGNGLGFFFPAPGVFQLQNTRALFSLTAVTPLSFDGVNTLTAPGVVYTGGTSPFDLGTIATAILACSTSSGHCTPDGVTVGGGLVFNTGTATLTDAPFTCGSNTWVSSTSTSGPACTPIGVGNLQSISAHTIVANATALAAPPAQTSIGTTMAFDGTGQLQCVGLRDGGGVNHLTTGTWPISSLLGTDVSGNIADGVSVPCGALPAFTGGIVSAGGTCAVGLDGPSVSAASTKMSFSL